MGSFKFQREKSLAQKKLSFDAKTAFDRRTSLSRVNTDFDMMSEGSSNGADEDDEARMLFIEARKAGQVQSPLTKASKLSFRFQAKKSNAFLGCRVSMQRVVTEVSANGSAAEAGIRIGDILMGTSETSFSTSDDFVRFVANLSVGEKVTMVVHRQGTVREIPMVVGALKDDLVSGSDAAARAVFLRAANASLLKEYLSDTAKFATYLRRSFDIVDTQNTGRVARDKFRMVIEVFTNAIGVSAPPAGEVDKAFQAVDTGRAGFLSLQECATACHVCFQSMLAEIKPSGAESDAQSSPRVANNPLSALGSPRSPKR
jgi:hypothetical protein